MDLSSCRYQWVQAPLGCEGTVIGIGMSICRYAWRCRYVYTCTYVYSGIGLDRYIATGTGADWLITICKLGHSHWYRCRLANHDL